MIRHLPMFLSGMTKGRSFPAIAQVPLRDFFHTIKQDVKNPKGTIAIFAGYLLNFVYTPRRAPAELRLQGHGPDPDGDAPHPQRQRRGARHQADDGGRPDRHGLGDPRDGEARGQDLGDRERRGDHHPGRHRQRDEEVPVA